MPAAPEAWAPPETDTPVAPAAESSWSPPETDTPVGPTPAYNAVFDRRMNLMYSGGLDNVHKHLSDTQNSTLNDLLGSTDNPNEMKANMLNRAYIAHNKPEMAPYMDDNMAAVNKSFAKEVFGVDKPEVTGVELYGHISNWYKQRQLLQEKAAELGPKIVEAAYQGNSDYASLVPKVARPEHQAYLDEYAARVAASVKDQSHLLSPSVVKVAGLMEQFRNGSDQSLIPQMVDEIEHLDPQQRETVVSMAALKVQKEMGEADNSLVPIAPQAGLGAANDFAGEVGQRLGRGVASMVQGVRSMGANLGIFRIDSDAADQRGDASNWEDARTQVMKAYNAIADPVEGKNLASKVALGLASFAPQMGAIMASPVVGLSAVFAESQNQRASDLMGQGVDRTKAFAMAAPQAMVDALSQMVSTNIVFKGALAPLEQTAARSMGDVAMRTLKVAGAEAATLGGITAAQEFMPAAMQDWGHKLDQTIPEIQWADSADGKTKGMLHQLGDALPETALSVVALMMLGTARAGLAETSKFRDSLGHVEILKAAGYTPEQADKVADQATPDGRLKVLQGMKPEAVNTPEQKAAIEKLDAENAAAAKDRTAVVSKSDDGKLWTITDADGKRIGSATTEEAANDIKAQHDQAQTAVSRGLAQLSDSIGGEEVKGEAKFVGGEKSAGEAPAKAEPAPEGPALKQVVGSAEDSHADQVLAEREKLPPEEQGFTPEIQSALAVKGAGLLDSGVTDFDRWSEEMRAQHGDAIEPHLRQIYDEAKALHEAQPERGAAQSAKDAMEETWNGEESFGGARARPNEDGTWTVLDHEGNEVGKADTPEAALDLVRETNKADSATENEIINNDIEYIRGLGSKVEKGGKALGLRDKTKGEKNPEEAAKNILQLYKDLGIVPQDMTLDQARIYGESVRVYNAKTKLYDDLIRIRDGADPTVPWEEKFEEYFKQQLRNGAFTLADAEKWRSEIEGKPFAPREDEAMRRREATEWFSSHGLAYITGKVDEGAILPLPLTFQRWLRRMKTAFAQMLGLGRRLMEMEKAGQLPDGFKKHLARAVGLDEAFLEQRAREEEAATLNKEKGVELLDWIAGKLPHPDTQEAVNASGELRDIYDSMVKRVKVEQKNLGDALRKGRNPKAAYEMVNKSGANAFFAKRGSEGSLGDVLVAAKEAGFKFDTAEEMLAAVTGSIGGKLTHANETFDEQRDTRSEARRAIVGGDSAALRKPKGDKTADMFDSGLAGEDFTLAGEKTEDHAGAVDSEEARREAQKRADAAQGEMTFALRTLRTLQPDQLEDKKLKPNHLYIWGNDRSGGDPVPSVTTVPYEGDALTAYRGMSSGDFAAHVIVATDAEGKPEKVISPNGKHVADFGTPEAEYIAGDVHAIDRALKNKITGLVESGDMGQATALADKKASEVMQEAAKYEGYIQRELTDDASDRKKLAEGKTVTDLDSRYDATKKEENAYFEQRRRRIESFTQTIAEKQAEAAKWQALVPRDSRAGMQDEMTFSLRKQVSEDRTEYDRLQAEMKKQIGEGKVGTPEFNKLWKQSEDIKNRHGGMPPGETAGGATYALRQAPFYSRLTRTVEESKQEKASGDQWKAMIRNSKLGVNKGEYDLVGVDDLQGDKIYHKQELLDFLKANTVKVQDVTLGAGEDEAKKINNDLTMKMAVDLPQKAKTAGMSQLDAANLPARLVDGRTSVEDLPESIRPDAEQFLKAHEEWTANNEKPAPKPTHFSQYTLPGAKEGSYREVLLTVPGYRAPTSSDGLPEGYYFSQETGGDWGIRNRDGGGIVARPHETKAEALAFARKFFVGWRDGHSQYGDIPNPVVRLRTNERTTADGKKMLFLEEVQAPQKGEFAKMPELFQKNWREIGFKYALRKAVESGMDALGWTTGDQQAERYDLSKQVNSVSYWRGEGENNNRFGLRVEGPNGETLHEQSNDANELEGVVGKELAAKMMANEGAPKNVEMSNGNVIPMKTFSGLDLKIGGEGLRKLYDQDFRNVVNGLPVVRKSGQKVGMSEIEVEKSGQSSSRYEVVQPEHSYSGRWDVVRRNEGAATSSHDSPAEAAAAAKALNSSAPQSVHSIDITPEMRSAIEGGQATFALRPHGLPEVAKEGKPGQQPLPGEIDEQAKAAQLEAAKAKKENYRKAGLTEFGPFREALNRFGAANQLTSLRIWRELKRIMKEVPDVRRREAITNYIQANGDLQVLKARAEASKPAYRQGYEDAMKLTPKEKSVAASASQFYKDMLVNLQKHEVLDAGVENYVNQMWKQEVLGEDPKSPAANFRLMTDLRNAKERVFGSYFDGEQAGKIPVTKDIAHLMAIYATEAGKVVSSRRFLKDLTTKKAEDGRALAAVQGQIQENGENLGVETGDKSEGPTFIKANAHPEGYQTIANPAFQGWKWLGKDKAGEPVMMKGQMALHPDIFRHMENVFGESAIDKALRPNDQNGALLAGTKTFARGLLKAQTFAKGTTLGFLSPFHQVQEGTHAIGHHVNPFWGSPDHLIDPDNPITRNAVEHGLMIAGDGQAMQMFKDSIDANLVHAIPGLLGKIPKVGEALKGVAESSASPITWSKDYAHYLFHDYIPRLKMKTFISIEANNLERYAKEMKAGTVTKADVSYLSAKQTNNAYGHMNWQDIGANPTIMHMARLAFLAPDFLAARAAFTGEAIKGAVGKKSGREQILAFMTLAATQYVTARILNKFADDDYHFDKPFSVVHAGREYTMRSVPEDLYKMIKQPEQFFKGRISPGVNMLQEALFQRNFRGEKVDYKDELKDMVSMFIPITLRANPLYRDYLETGGKSTVSWWQQLAGAAGIHISRNSPISETYKLAGNFKKGLSDEDKKKFNVVEDKGVYPTSKYQQLRYALEDGDMDKAMVEYQKLKDAGMGASKMDTGFHESVFHPFTGSKALDGAFARALPEDQRLMLELAQHSRDQIWKAFKAVESGEVGPAVAP